MTSALAYIRVSSRTQDLASQRSAIERAAGARGDAIDDWRAEKRSAKTMAREELQRLLVDARAGRLRGRRLYLFRLDRLTRTGIAGTLTTLDELRASGVEVVSVADGFDLAGAQAEIIIAVMAWAAKIERLAINERIAAARERVEAEGGRWGRPSRVDRPTLTRAVASGRRAVACELSRWRSGSPGAQSREPSLRTRRPKNLPEPRPPIRRRISGSSRGRMGSLLLGRSVPAHVADPWWTAGTRTPAGRSRRPVTV